MAIGCLSVNRFRALSERGVMKRQMQTWRPAPPRCYSTSEAQGVQLTATSLALILLAVGIFTSLIILFTERYLLHRSQAMPSKRCNSYC